MNEIKHIRIVIELDQWSAFGKQSQNEVDDLLFKIKQKQLLSHCGNIKIRMLEGADER